MSAQIKKPILLIIPGLIFGSFLFFLLAHLPFIRFLHWKCYDGLAKIECKFRKPPAAIKDILLVTIDNETLRNMPQHWPYPRADFAKVIANLQKAGAVVIGFDFVFFGASTAKDDSQLDCALDNNGRVVLASLINEESALDLPVSAGLNHGVPSGIITKLQDKDGITRRGLTYLVSAKEPNKGFLGWEMQVLRIAKKINLSSLESGPAFLSFKNAAGEKWIIPVAADTESFLIHFRAHTADFKRLSFYRALKGDFDPALVKEKIVLVGMLSSLLGDIHNSPMGFLPGLTLNANAFLTLYTHDFLKNLPGYLEAFILGIGIIISVFFSLHFKIKKALLLIAGEILLFFTASFILLTKGYIWNYFLFPFAVTFCPLLGKKLLDLKKGMCLNKANYGGGGKCTLKR